MIGISVVICIGSAVAAGCGADAEQREGIEHRNVCVDIAAERSAMNAVPIGAPPVRGPSFFVVDDQVYAMGSGHIYRSSVENPVPQVVHEFEGRPIELVRKNRELWLLRSTSLEDKLDRIDGVTGHVQTYALPRNTWSDVIGEFFGIDRGALVAVIPRSMEISSTRRAQLPSHLIRIDIETGVSSTVADDLPGAYPDLAARVGERLLLVYGEADPSRPSRIAEQNPSVIVDVSLSTGEIVQIESDVPDRDYSFTSLLDAYDKAIYVFAVDRTPGSTQENVPSNLSWISTETGRLQVVPRDRAMVVIDARQRLFLRVADGFEGFELIALDESHTEATVLGCWNQGVRHNEAEATGDGFVYVQVDAGVGASRIVRVPFHQ